MHLFTTIAMKCIISKWKLHARVCVYIYIFVSMYEGHLESKERFAIQRYLLIFINRKETEYAGFITHLHLLLHIVTLDIEALVVP